MSKTVEKNDLNEVWFTEFKVLGTLLLLLLTIEAGVRFFEGRQLVDVQQFQAFEELAEQIRLRTDLHVVAEQRQAGDRASPPPQILFLGNSAAQHSLNRAAFADTCARQTGLAPEVFVMHPEHSQISEWSNLYRNLLSNQERAPDILVVSFTGTQLSDAHSRPSDAGTVSDPQDLANAGRISRDAKQSVEGWSELFGARCSATYANRHHRERQLLGAIIPQYHATSHLLTDPSSSQEPVETASTVTYRQLSEFLQLAQRDHVEVVLVALPTQSGYHLDAQLAQLARDQEVTLMDCRLVPGITPAMFSDASNLTPAGAVQYSEYLAQWLPLAPLIARHDELVSPHTTERIRMANEAPGSTVEQ